MDDKSEQELLREIVETERDQDEITGYVAQWVARNPRPKVSIDVLANMKDIWPRVEAWTDKVFWDGDNGRRAYILTFDGTFAGTRLLGNTLGGDPILAMAGSEDEARRLAYSGIQDTIEAARRHYFLQEGTIVRDPREDGYDVDVGGRRLQHDPFGRPDNRMARIINDVLKKSN